MHFATAFLSILSSLLVSQRTVAAPTTELEVANTTSAAATANILICSDSQFNGNCGDFSIGNNECLTFPSNLQKDVSSIALFNGGSYGCEAYVDVACFADQGNFFFSTAQGDLSSTGFNDRLSSVICSYNL
ncbi:hypothetical protein BDY19DRAFT_932394 [Irpex rosettiformis]|uniref:Uncharacterized protein n=1 Tax=Irpex rosettiformis TaxID=378272 RepID=A0ACB8U951_9APHY|nr:hypothetical protein BDY19DRAFT_932394 [Irpex rosettiformis]